jgi:hypothetical protein
MIVRIMAEDQYRVTNEQMPEVQRLDEALDHAVELNDDDAFAATLQQLVTFVREHGEVVPDEEVVPSDIIIPAPDMSLAEAQARLHPVETPPAPSE